MRPTTEPNERQRSLRSHARLLAAAAPAPVVAPSVDASTLQQDENQDMGSDNPSLKRPAATSPNVSPDRASSGKPPAKRSNRDAVEIVPFVGPTAVEETHAMMLHDPSDRQFTEAFAQQITYDLNEQTVTVQRQIHFVSEEPRTLAQETDATSGALQRYGLSHVTDAHPGSLPLLGSSSHETDVFSGSRLICGPSSPNMDAQCDELSLYSPSAAHSTALDSFEMDLTTSSHENDESMAGTQRQLAPQDPSNNIPVAYLPTSAQQTATTFQRLLVSANNLAQEAVQAQALATQETARAHERVLEVELRQLLASAAIERRAWYLQGAEASLIERQQQLEHLFAQQSQSQSDLVLARVLELQATFDQELASARESAYTKAQQATASQLEEASRLVHQEASNVRQLEQQLEQAKVQVQELEVRNNSLVLEVGHLQAAFQSKLQEHAQEQPLLNERIQTLEAAQQPQPQLSLEALYSSKLEALRSELLAELLVTRSELSVTRSEFSNQVSKLAQNMSNIEHAQHETSKGVASIASAVQDLGSEIKQEASKVISKDSRAAMD